MKTIVGGRPRGRGDGGSRFSRGIEVLLLKASVDAEFRELLSGDWRAAADSISLELSSAERSVLESVPGAVLVAAAGRMRVPEEHRTVFAGKVSAAMLAVLAAMASVGCSPSPPPPPAPQPPAGPVRNEPAGWHPPIWIAGLVEKLDNPYPFESEDAVPGPGDGDPREVNEPPWGSIKIIAGVMPEWNERDEAYESEDEPPPEDR